MALWGQSRLSSPSRQLFRLPLASDVYPFNRRYHERVTTVTSVTVGTPHCILAEEAFTQKPLPSRLIPSRGRRRRRSAHNGKCKKDRRSSSRLLHSSLGRRRKGNFLPRETPSDDIVIRDPTLALNFNVGLEEGCLFRFHLRKLVSELISYKL